MPLVHLPFLQLSLHIRHGGQGHLLDVIIHWRGAVGGRRAEDLSKSRALGFCHLGREVHGKVDVEVSLGERIARDGHSFIGDACPSIRVDDLAGGLLDVEHPVIQVGDVHGEPGQGFDEADGFLHEKIVTDPLERVVRNLLQDKDEVARKHVRRVGARLAVENDLRVLARTALDVHLEYFLVGHKACPRALAATVGRRAGESRPRAARAALLDLLDHSRSELTELDLRPTSVAVTTLVLFAALRPRGVALWALDTPGALQLPGATLVHVLEVDLQPMDRIFALPLARSASAAPSHAEEVEDVGATSHASRAAIFEALFAVLIVDGTLLLVTKDLVRLVDLLELLGVASLVRVVLQRELPVCLLDFVWGRRFVHPEELVVLLVVYGTLRTSSKSTRHPAKAARHSAEEHGRRRMEVSISNARTSLPSTQSAKDRQRRLICSLQV
mmetsp:Transcript_12794/g.36608  ORF Transcript_12794/g.36608 Transcript_12794/m.36608 type:complete len:443 (+) Transcript_12794:6204-7532(+)